MLLHHLGDERPEEEIRTLLGCTTFGTFIQSLYQVTRLGYRVAVRYSTWQELQHYLDHDQPVLVGVRTAFLDDWLRDCPHAVVVVGYDEKNVYLNDLYFDQAPQQTSRSSFLKAWRSTRNRLVIVELGSKAEGSTRRPYVHGPR